MFTLIDEGMKACTCEGNHVFGDCQGPENYESTTCLLPAAVIVYGTNWSCNATSVV